MSRRHASARIAERAHLIQLRRQGAEGGPETLGPIRPRLRGPIGPNHLAASFSSLSTGFPASTPMRQVTANRTLSRWYTTSGLVLKGELDGDHVNDVEDATLPPVGPGRV